MVRSIALLLTVLTGTTGLVYEVAWQKSLAILLGSHSEATAAVLALFLGGLSVGYALFGRVTRRVVEGARAAGRPPRLLLLYGAVEASIGVWALLFPLLFAGAQALSVRLPAGPEAAAFAVDVALCALLIGPPTILMGGTIPILTQALARSLQDATRFHAFVYGFNTAGAFAGALAGGFFLIPWLGIPGTLRWMGCVNLLAGSLFAALGLRPGPATPSPQEPGAPRPQGFGDYALVAALLGFGMMAVQTVLIRIGGLAFGASHFTFAMVVAVFVLCIALGSLAVSAFDRIPRSAPAVCIFALAALLLALYRPLPDAPYYAHVLRTFFRDLDAAFYPFWLAAFLCILAVLALPVGLAGATLPLLFHQLRREVGNLGDVAGRLYSWNTVGSLLGALLGGYVLLVWLDLHHVFRLAIAAVALAGLVLTVRVHGLSRAGAAVLGAAALGGLVFAGAWEPQRLSAGLFRYRAPGPASYQGPDVMLAGAASIPFYDDDPTASVTVMESHRSGLRAVAIITNGKPDGTLVVGGHDSLVGDYPTMALAALLPCLFAERCEEAFVIGYGTGVTVGEFAALDAMRHVEVAEISRGVIRAAPYFEDGNQGASRSDKVHIVRSDAYRALLRSDRTFDAIASEPSNPWVTGVEMLFSREFLEAAKRRLRPGGVYAQWFHTYETDQATVELVLRTFASVFDDVAVWFTMGPDLIVLGLERGAPAADLDRLAARAGAPDFTEGLRRAGIGSLPALLAHEVLPRGVVRSAPLGTDVHTLLHPLLSQRAARAFFRGQTAGLPPTAGGEAATLGARNALLGTYLRRQGGRLGADAWREVVDQLCDRMRPECAAALARWSVDAPGSPELAAALEAKRRVPGLAEPLSRPRLERLAGFFGDGVRGVSTVESASADTELFARHYYHALPFRRAALRAVWGRCVGPACAQGRNQAERFFASPPPPAD